MAARPLRTDTTALWCAGLRACIRARALTTAWAKHPRPRQQSAACRPTEVPCFACPLPQRKRPLTPIPHPSSCFAPPGVHAPLSRARGHPGPGLVVPLRPVEHRLHPGGAGHGRRAVPDAREPGAPRNDGAGACTRVMVSRRRGLAGAGAGRQLRTQPRTLHVALQAARAPARPGLLGQVSLA